MQFFRVLNIVKTSSFQQSNPKKTQKHEYVFSGLMVFKSNFISRSYSNVNSVYYLFYRSHRTAMTRDSISSGSARMSPCTKNLPCVHQIRQKECKTSKQRMPVLTIFICLLYKHTGVIARGCPFAFPSWQTKKNTCRGNLCTGLYKAHLPITH